ncbi:MAG: hypothetical protein ACPGEC_03420 [Flavobacteriales bacterium]
MKKSLIYCSLFLSGIALQAQEIGIYYGKNNVLMSQEADNRISTTNSSGAPETIVTDYSSSWGYELGMTYRHNLSHAFSAEYAFGYQSIRPDVDVTRILSNSSITKTERNTLNYLNIKPTLQYWLNDNWTISGGLNLRLGMGGSYTLLNVYDEVFLKSEPKPFALNHLDAQFGINYKLINGLSLYSNFQLPMVNFNGAPKEYFYPTGIITFGAMFRIERDKLSSYSK